MRAREHNKHQSCPQSTISPMGRGGRPSNPTNQSECAASPIVAPSGPGPLATLLLGTTPGTNSENSFRSSDTILPVSRSVRLPVDQSMLGHSGCGNQFSLAMAQLRRLFPAFGQPGFIKWEIDLYPRLHSYTIASGSGSKGQNLHTSFRPKSS